MLHAWDSACSNLLAIARGQLVTGSSPPTGSPRAASAASSSSDRHTISCRARSAAASIARSPVGPRAPCPPVAAETARSARMAAFGPYISDARWHRHHSWHRSLLPPSHPHGTPSRCARACLWKLFSVSKNVAVDDHHSRQGNCRVSFSPSAMPMLTREHPRHNRDRRLTRPFEGHCTTGHPHRRLPQVVPLAFACARSGSRKRCAPGRAPHRCTADASPDRAA